MKTSDSTRDFCVLIISYGRADNVLSYKLMTSISKAPVYIICSDDDKTLPRYKELYGEDHILVFNKEEEKKNFDVGDNFPGMYNSSCFAHNTYFRFARQLGFKYFLAMDDDSMWYVIRYINLNEKPKEKNGKTYRTLHYAKIPQGYFDKICEQYFRLLDSAPWIYCTAFAQGGDFIGGQYSQVYQDGVKFKAMNSFFCCTDKEWKMPGRINEDASAYCVNNPTGKLFMTIPGVMLQQPPTQQCSGGMTDIYKNNGTWLKTAYTVMMCPSAVKFSYKFGRVHHHIINDNNVPKIISSRYRKECNPD